MKKNLKIISLIIVSIYLCLGGGFAASQKPFFKKIKLTLSHTIGKGVLNYPGLEVMGHNTLVIDDGSLYLYDSKGQFPFYALDSKTMKLKGFGSWGEGPGEVTKGLPVILSHTKEDLFIYLPLGMRLLIFKKSNLEFQHEIKIPQFQFGSTFYMINDELGIYVNMGLETKGITFAQAYQLDSVKKILKEASINYAEYKKFPQLNRLKDNPMLKKGPLHKDSEGNIYFANYYSSLIMGFFKERGTNLYHFRTSWN